MHSGLLSAERSVAWLGGCHCCCYHIWLWPKLFSSIQWNFVSCLWRVQVCLCACARQLGNPCSKENGVGTRQPEAHTQHELSALIQRSNEMVVFPEFQAEHSAHVRAFGAFIGEHCFMATYKKKDLGSTMQISVLVPIKWASFLRMLFFFLMAIFCLAIFKEGR